MITPHYPKNPHQGGLHSRPHESEAGLYRLCTKPNSMWSPPTVPAAPFFKIYSKDSVIRGGFRRLSRSYCL